MDPRVMTDARAYFAGKPTVVLSDTPCGWKHQLDTLQRYDTDDRLLTNAARTIATRLNAERATQARLRPGCRIDPLEMAGDIEITLGAYAATKLCWRGVRMADGRHVWNGAPIGLRQLREEFDADEEGTYDYLSVVM